MKEHAFKKLHNWESLVRFRVKFGAHAKETAAKLIEHIWGLLNPRQNVLTGPLMILDTKKTV